MPDTPYGVTGCRCRIADDYSDWITNPHCPYHGLLPRDRTDTGVYRVIPAEIPLAPEDAEVFNRCYAGNGCNYQEPHKHGFACDKTCATCHGHYPECPPGIHSIFDPCPGGCLNDDGCGPVGHTDMAALNRQYREKYGAFSKKPAWWRRLFRR